MSVLGSRAWSVLQSWGLGYISKPGNPGLGNSHPPPVVTIVEELSTR